MKFEDHISGYWAKAVSERGFDQVAAQGRIDDLCLAMVAMLSQGLTVLSLARELKQEVRRAIIGAEQVYRYELKLKMLRLPEWRYKVLKDLGGIEKLICLWKRFSEQKALPSVTFKRQKKVLSYEELRQRAHAKLCAKACAHPLIYRDPFRVDQEGQFRLPPMPRQASQKLNTRVYEYKYDARPVSDFTGLNTPIMVWPEEFMVFMGWEERKVEDKDETKETPRRFPFLERWLAALLEDTAESIPPQPFIKIKTARAPPYMRGSCETNTTCRERQVAKGASLILPLWIKIALRFN